MKKILLMAAVAVFLGTTLGYCFDFSFGYRARTGDKEFDISMGNLNVEAKCDMNNFIEDLSINFGRPRNEVEHLLYVVKMPPADAFLTLRIARLLNKPYLVVVDEYKANKGKGWGVIAQRLGIKPGSSEFHELKKNTANEVIVIRDKKGKCKVKGKAEQEQHGKGKNK